MSKHHHHHHSIGGHHHSSSNHTTGLSPHHHHLIDTSCNPTISHAEHHHHHGNHSLDLVTTLRSELAAISYKRDRLVNELTETKSSLCAKDTECESLRAQAARQSAHISSLQSRLQATETRERNNQARSDSTIQSIQHEKRCLEEKNKELTGIVRRLEIDCSNEESHKEQAKNTLHELIRKLCVCLEIDICDPAHLSPDCVVNKAGEVVSELHRLRTKLATTCDTLTSCENEMMNFKSISNAEKERLNAQLEAMQSHNHDLEGRCRQFERDLQICRDRLSESDICNEKLKEELRGFESRCQRLENTMDRFQKDRMSFLRTLASILNVAEPCETLIKDKIRENLNENQTMHTQLHNLRDQLTAEQNRSKDTIESANCRIRSEEAQKSAIEERLEKALAEINELRCEHTTLSEYLVRLARALCWSECSSPPTPGTDTTILAESLLERADRLTAHHEHHAHLCDKTCHDQHPHPHPHPHQHHHHHTPHHGPKLRRERSCHDIPLKESSAMYTLQRRVRVLREQVQRRDLHLELLRRKIALLEDGNRGKCVLQGERDEAICRAKKANKQIDKLSNQLVEAKAQLAELKAQIAEAVEHKITSLERARKIDELNSRNCDLESEKSRLVSQVSALKERTRSAVSTSQERRCRDEVLINSLRDDISRLERQLSDANHRLSHLQSFRTSVARTLHLRDIPETDLLHRLQTLCSAHQEFTLLSRRYESASPIGEHACPRFDDPLPPSLLCRPLSSSSPTNHHHHHSRHRGNDGGSREKGGGGGGGGNNNNKNRSKYDDVSSAFNDDHFEDDFDYKKY